MISNLFPISKFGFKYIVFSFFAFVIFQILDFDFLALASLAASIVFLYLFRNPERDIPVFSDGSLVSPVDGVLTAIKELEDSQYGYRLEIESSYKDIGVLRVPMEATVENVTINKGARLSKSNSLSQEINEFAEIEFKDTIGNKINVIHTLKQSFSAISLDIIKEQKVRQAMRYGFAQNTTSYIYTPKNFRINVNISNELKGSETLLGYFS
jgi:phosphatidylserine decarboxylase